MDEKTEPKKPKVKYYLKMISSSSTISESFDTAKTDIETLAEEMRNWEENMSGAGTNLENTSRYETVSETADQLENARDSLQDLEVPECIKLSSVNVKEYKNTKARWRILANAVNNLQAVINFLESSDCPQIPDDNKNSIEEFKDGLQETINEADGVDFPTMYG